MLRYDRRFQWCYPCLSCRKRLFISSTIWTLTHWGRNKIATIFQTSFFNACCWMKMYQFGFVKISLKLVPRGLINNIPELVQIMAWRRPGDKPLSEPMMVSLPTHICVSRPQWVNVLSENECVWRLVWIFMAFVILPSPPCVLYSIIHPWLMLREAVADGLAPWM